MMKISMTTIIILTTLFCVLPYLWFLVVARNSTNKLKKQISNAVKKENLPFTIKEQWNNHFIGINDAQNMLMFLMVKSLETSLLKIDLTEVKNCEIIKKSRDYKKENKRESELQSLDLKVSFFSEKEPVFLSFYDMAAEFSENYEMKRIEKWQALIHQKIVHLQSHSKVA